LSEQKRLANDALQHLLLITEDEFQDSVREDLLAPLCKAPTASLFVLSREAAASGIRLEAEAVLTARLREDREEETTTPPVDVANLEELPPELATHRHFYKFSEGEQWVLTTRGGVRVRAFANEAELDQWWHGLKRQRGRILTRRRRETSPNAESVVPSPILP
jgi:hypothetical protein